MSKIKRKITECDRARDIEISVNVVIDVNSDGWFTTTLSESDADMISSYGISLAENRAHRAGFFKAETLGGLLSQIRNVLQSCLTYNVLEEKVILKYAFDIKCSYCIDTQTGDVKPNGYWVNDSFEWREGNKEVISHSFVRVDGCGINIWCKPFIKKTVGYGNGTQKVFYNKYEESKEKSELDFLAATIMSSNPVGLGSIREIDATEENCRFFAKIIRSIWNMNEKLGEILKQGKIELLINQTLMLT